MGENALIKWIETVMNGLPKFLESMKDDNISGRYKYSLVPLCKLNNEI